MAYVVVPSDFFSSLATSWSPYMEDRRMKKKVRSEDEDKISKLSNDVIHQIMSFLDTREAVQTCILSQRWKLVWTTLPFLNFNYNQYRRIYKFPESCLVCLPALTNLCLNQCDLPDFISLPSLTTLSLESCKLPKTVWDFPALSTLKLVEVFFPKNMSEYFLALASLRNLTIDLDSWYIGCCDISSSRLTNLKISSPLETASQVKIVVRAPKLCNFEAVGFFWMTFEGSELENVDIKFWDCTMYDNEAQFWRMEPDLFKIMFSQLGSTKILTLDSLTLQALSENSGILVHSDSPFYKLKYMKLPHECEESSISSSVRQYLLGGSPSAIFVKTLSQDNVSPQMDLGACTIAQDVVLRESLVTPTKDMIN